MTTVSDLAPAPSETWTFFKGAWREGNAAIMGVRTHASWLGSSVFDGARRFEGVFPDLDAHCRRINRSAEALGLDPVVPPEQWLELAREGARRFAPDVALYIKPMYWPEGGSGGGVMFDGSDPSWCLSLYASPMPPTTGASVTLSPFSKPSGSVAPVEAKAGCLYPNNARALREAKSRGFDNCLMRDDGERIAELANANVFLARDGVVFTPAPTGLFLSGITRARTIALLRDDGVEVVETRLTHDDFLKADEIFSCGNFQKVAPVVRIEERVLPQGPLYLRARRLYWAYAHEHGR